MARERAADRAGPVCRCRAGGWPRAPDGRAGSCGARSPATGSSVMPISLSPSAPRRRGRGALGMGEPHRDGRMGGTERARPSASPGRPREWGARRGRGAPRRRPPPASTSARTMSSARSTSRAAGTNASPAAVSVVRRPTRRNSSTPSSRSSVPTACESDGWATKQAAAAAVNVPWSATARAYRS